MEVEVTVGAGVAVHADISVAEVVTVPSSEVSNHENHEGNENDDGKVGESPEDLEVDTVSDHDVPAERVEPVEVEPEVERQISEEEVEVNEAEVDSPSTPVIRPEPGKHPGLDPVQDPSEVVVSEPEEIGHNEHDLPVVQADGPEDEPSEPEEDPESPLAQTDGGYTSASHSYHSDSDDEEALQAELAVKEGEHDKLASQLQMMQQEMEALRRMLEQNQQELANSSKETEDERAGGGIFLATFHITTVRVPPFDCILSFCGTKQLSLEILISCQYIIYMGVDVKVIVLSVVCDDLWYAKMTFWRKLKPEFAKVTYFFAKVSQK